MAKLKDRKKESKILARSTDKIDKTCQADQSNIRDKLVENEEIHERKKLRNKKRNDYRTAETGSIKRGKNSDRVDGFTEQNGRANEVHESTKRKPKKKRSKKETKPPVDEVDMETKNNPEQGNSLKTGKSRKANKKKTMEVEDILQKRDTVEEDIYQISSGDEDCSKGMKKWIVEYHQQRPGLKVLQERIDDFITAHEAMEEQERREREARVAEDGWTVVTHHKGRKKTTDAETGVVVGSVNQATVLDKMAKKKNKEVGLDFYRFQKREAQRNEIMMLQNKFEQDKRRIQQLRAARKFRPY